MRTNRVSVTGILVFFFEGEESVDCGLECCVDLVVAVAKARDRSFNLASVEHVELVEGLASVEHQVRRLVERLSLW